MKKEQKIIEEVKLAKEGTIMADFQKERTDAISEMFDNVKKFGIYPTGKFFVRLDKALEKALTRQKQEFRERIENRIKVLANVSDIRNVGLVHLPPNIQVAVQELEDILKNL